MTATHYQAATTVTHDFISTLLNSKSLLKCQLNVENQSELTVALVIQQQD